MNEIYKMNLQLFADPNDFYSGQTSPMHTTTGLSAEMKTFYSKDLIETVGPNLVYAQFGDPVTIGHGKGKQIEWRKFGKFAKALKPLTEGVTPQASAITVTPMTKKVEQFGDWSIITDVLSMTAIDPVIVETTARHAENAKMTLDTIVRNELMCGTQVLYAQDGDGGDVTSRAGLDETCKMTVDTVARAVRILKNQNAPKIDGSYVAIVHPSVSYDLQRDPQFIDVAKYADATRIFNGEIGKLYGVRFVETTEAPVFVHKMANSITISAISEDRMTLTISGKTAEELAALVGHVLYVSHTGTGVNPVYESVSIVDSAATTVTLARPMTDPGTSYTTHTMVDQAGTSNRAVYATLFLGKGAYKVVSLDGGNAEIIVEQAGSGGTSDPLHQRSTVGWKVNGYGAAIVLEEYILRVESCSTFNDDDGNI